MLLPISSIRYHDWNVTPMRNIYHVDCFFTMENQVFIRIFAMMSLISKCACALDYSRQNLTSVPPPPNGTDTIHQLNLANNYIQSLNNTSFIGYDDLKTLSLQSNGLEFVKDGTFIKMYQLQILVMRNNDIKQLPSIVGPSDQTLIDFDLWVAIRSKNVLAYPYFAAFIKLRGVKLGGSYNLQSFQAAILPPKLKILNLNYGKVSTFPNLSPYVPLLREIYISHNRLEIIPQSMIAWLSKLEIFKATSNRITNFPSFLNSSLLEILDLQSNRIAVTPRANIEGLIRLRIFKLQHNRMTRMTNISHITSLKEFNIGYNEISELPEDIFYGLPNLIQLSCEFNRIAVLPDVLAILPNLRQFYVQGNRLLTLPDYYQHSSPLTFHVEDNPLVCNRSICWLRMLSWTNPASPLNLDSPTCAAPPILADVRVVRAHPNEMECYDGNFVFLCLDITIVQSLYNTSSLNAI